MTKFGLPAVQVFAKTLGPARALLRQLCVPWQWLSMPTTLEVSARPHRHVDVWL
jgi:hypothetical protein